MGNLRAKAKREVDSAKRAEKKRRADQAKRARERHAERVRPAAEFLTEWADETVTAEQLEDISGDSGPSVYKVKLDGFDLVVRVTGDGKAEEHLFSLTQISPDGDKQREVEAPAELLSPWGDV